MGWGLVRGSVAVLLERGDGSPLGRAMREGVVVRWLGRLGGETRHSYFYNFRGWLLWLWRVPEWSGKTPTQILEWQDQAHGRERFQLLDLMTEYVQEKGGTYKGMSSRLSHLRSFFLHNRVELPDIKDWQPHPTHEPTQGNLTTERVHDIISHANMRDTAIFLTMFQSMMDLHRFTQFNQKYTLQLVTHLKEKGVDEPFRIDFLSGRKRNRRAFYTFIYHDALVAWRNYFDSERGWPKHENEPMAMTWKGTPPKKEAIRASFTTISRRLHLRPKTSNGRPSGVSPHEAFRDVVRTLLQTAKRKGFDTTCAEFWMGHSVDPYNYNKFAELEPDYVIENAKIASQYLNIISHAPTEENEERDTHIKQLQAKYEVLEEQVRSLRGELTPAKVHPA